jgi:hypothetical protein
MLAAAGLAAMAQKWSAIIARRAPDATGALSRHLLSGASNHDVTECIMMIFCCFYNVSN